MRKITLIIMIAIMSVMMPLNVFAAKKTPIKKIVMFGDSYGQYPHGEKHWNDRVKSEFNIPKENVVQRIRGGSGFAMKNEKKNFVEKIKKLEKDDSVNVILVVGGVTNDMGHSRECVKKKMKEFSKIAKKKFPNAKIYYGIPNWTHKGKEREANILKRKEYCIKVAKSLKWKVLSKTEKCLYQKRKWYWKDLRHPNTKGQTIIGDALVADLKKAGLEKVHNK